MPPTIAARFDGTEYSRADVLSWEDRRITAAARLLDVQVPHGDVAIRRRTLLHAKLALGPDEIAARLRRRTAAADIVARAGSQLSRRRRISAIDLHVGTGSAEEFVTTFDRWTQTSDHEAMLRACPDHYVIRTDANGRQEVLETTGGSPLPSLFRIDYSDVSSLTTAPNARFPLQIAGVARASDGSVIGGVRHQFRDDADGFSARLTVEFPLPTPRRMIGGHRWHLACEFSNWIEAAFGWAPFDQTR
ncbi:hypothetical protein [Mycolicibacterium sp. 018/SC-01/001]|uniref:hypothetical protein n=1 Tax=Mycolicibacterium sp. 018/SC-01/001 TaxID=2592069 RepID=UPI00163D7019|nr:hypothetical protein [Mycolicibacterium sp. 018/SC-01/001]